MADRAAIVADLQALVARVQAGLSALAAMPEPVATEPPERDLAVLFDIIRRQYGSVPEELVPAVDAWAKGGPIPRPKTLQASDFVSAAARLRCSVAQIRAVDEVESAGGGLEPGRADILALDGPGGFLDGDLPKILFEAHKFSKHTGRRFDRSHPSLSSVKWNRSLYKGGQAEYGRLYAAMQLDRVAALKSASWGRYQILGENHALAGFTNVEAFVEAMKRDERAHLDAFCSFVEKAGLLDELRKVSARSSDCLDFSLGYNGPSAEANGYPKRIATAFIRYSK